MLKALAVVSLFVVGACNDGIAPPGGSGIALLEIGPDPLILLPGDTVQLTAIARSASGAIIPNPPITWQSSDTTALTISATGKATALRGADSVRITARADNRTASFEPYLCSVQSYWTEGRFSLLGWSGHFELARFESTPILHSGGVMYGTNETDFVIASVPAANWHVYPGPSCQLTLPEGRYIRNRITVRDGLTNGPVSPVQATEEIFEPSNPLAEGVILVRYTFRNITNLPIEKFRLGLWFDWDLIFNPTTGAGNNYARYNPAVGTAETFQATLETAGIAGINTPITSFQASDRTADWRTVAANIALLTSGTTSDVTGPADVRFAAGFGPFDIAPGQSQTVMLVITAGRTREDFERRISIGRSAASAFPSVATLLAP